MLTVAAGTFQEFSYMPTFPAFVFKYWHRHNSFLETQEEEQKANA